MNAEILKNAGVEYDDGVKRFAGRAQLYEKTLMKFSKDTTFSRIKAAYEAGDKDGLLASAHEFKGMCGNISLTSLYKTSDAMVRLLRADEYPGAAFDSLYGQLKADYTRTYEAVSAAMESIS